MKTTRILSALMITLILSLTSSSLFGQSKVSVPNSNGKAFMVSDNNKEFGLEINGKLVTSKTYTSFVTSEGNFFAVTAKDGKMGICDATGNFIHPCKYAKTTVTGNFLGVYEEQNGKPKFYSKDAPTVEVVAKEANISEIEDQIAAKNGGMDPKRNKQKRATAEAQRLSELAPKGAFEIKDDGKGKQNLLVDGKVLFTATTFQIAFDEKWYNESTCWFFIITDTQGGFTEYYGIYGLSIYYKDGKKCIENYITVPYKEYSLIQVYQPGVFKAYKNMGENFISGLGNKVTFKK